MQPTSSVEPEAAWPIPLDAKTVVVNGYPMAYQEFGAGPPIVLVHGSLNDYRVWYAQTPELSKHHRVIAVSLRRHYPERWDGQGSDYTVEQHARDVAVLIKALRLGKAHLLGHSSGGFIALNTARLHPEVVRSLVLAEPSDLESLLPETPESRKAAADAQALFATLKQNMATGDRERAAREFTDAVVGPGTWDKRPAEVKRMLLDNLGTGIGDPGHKPRITCDDIRRQDVPILVVRGERSPRRYIEMATALHACQPTQPAPVVVPNASHSMNRDNPAVFNAAVLEFLARH